MTEYAAPDRFPSGQTIAPLPATLAQRRAAAVQESGPKLIAFDQRKLDAIPEFSRLPPDVLDGIRLAARVFPFKVNKYVLESLIDWEKAPDDPIFRLTVPHLAMLAQDDADRLRALLRRGAADAELGHLVDEIRARMNPHPADQALNSPIFADSLLTGVQHKYTETVLFFPKQGQTCHSYCSFCFRWPQFVSGSLHKFGSSDAAQLHAYLRQNRAVTDLLLTGGDPMVMSTRRLEQYLEPLLSRDLRHVQNIRIGTKALTYWPYRFIRGSEGQELLDLIRRLTDGGKHVAIMAHLCHWREMAPQPFQEAVGQLLRAGAVIRSQSPILRHINDDATVWKRNWTDQVRLGIVPYYMFVPRDTGAQQYFALPLAQALEIYRAAFGSVSGIARTARGPVMSTGPGKIQVLGTIRLHNESFFVLTFLQARQPHWLQRPFLAKFSDVAAWIDQLQAPDEEGRFFFEHDYEDFVSGLNAKHPGAENGFA